MGVSGIRAYYVLAGVAPVLVHKSCRVETTGHRGVPEDNPGYAAATEGTAAPRGRCFYCRDAPTGYTDSPYVSWTTREQGTIAREVLGARSPACGGQASAQGHQDRTALCKMWSIRILATGSQMGKRMERRMSVLTLILLVALATSAVVAVRNSWQLLSKADSSSDKFRRLAKTAAGVGGVLIVIPLVAGVHGWGLKLFAAGSIICFLCYLFFFYTPGSTSERSD